MDISQKEYFKYYILGGLEIFPCGRNKKSPLTTNGFKDASSDKQVINDWWDKHPDANIGLPTGKANNLVVVDVDVKNDADGMASLKQLQDECGEFDTRVVHTPSGGLHFYFKYPQGVYTIKNRTNMKPGIDIRADGGYVIAPGSSINGNYYEFDDKDKDITELPQKLLEMLTEDKQLKSIQWNESAPVAGNGVKKGNRNWEAFRYASKLRGDDLPYEDAETKVLDMTFKCEPPLGQDEALKCLKSAYESFPAGRESIQLKNTEHLTELGSAKSLVDSYGSNIRFVHQYDKWMYWDGHRWCIDDDGHIYRLAKQNALSRYDQVSSIEDYDRRREMTKYATRSESRQAIEATIHLAKSEFGIPLRIEDLDTDPYLLGVANGVVNLKTGGLRENSKSEFITKQAPVVFSPEAECPLWISFLNQAMDNNQEMIDYLQLIIGYSLTGDTREQKLFFLYGFGANGKSVFVNTIQEMLGDYAKQTPVSTLMTRAKGSVNNDVARLKSARFVATTETEEGSKFNESELKLLTGQDVITARFFRQEFFEFRPEFKLFVSGNHKPVPGDGHGIWRRLVLIPFEVIVKDEDQDKELQNKLKAEFSGILNWAIEGCLRWQKEGLKEPKEILDAIAEYKSEMDRIKNWMDECCKTGNPHEHLTQSTPLYNSYKHWAYENGEWQMSQRSFGQKLKERGYDKKRKNGGNYYLGISVKDGEF